MNEEVMYWLAAASNRRQISDPMLRFMEINKPGTGYNGGKVGNLWMVHNYYKVLNFQGNLTSHADRILDMIASGLPSRKKLGGIDTTDGKFHIDGCGSPEYTCFPPFDAEPARVPHCVIERDCSYALAQLRWGLTTALELVGRYAVNASSADVAWWKVLNESLVDFPVDPSTGYRLSSNCSFNCPHRHFSHLLQIFDLEVVDPKGPVSLQSIDRFYAVSCNSSNWFNEECRGFTQCGLTSMNAVAGRREAAAGNLTALIDNTTTPNGMYGEMVYFHHPDEFCPVSESAYCGAGSIHTLLLHASPLSGVLSFFPGLPPSWPDANFHQLRAANGLMVSASRKAGRTEWVHLTATVGGAFLFNVPDDAAGWGTAAPHSLPASVTVSRANNYSWMVNLHATESVALWPASQPQPPNFTIAPLAGNPSEYNYWGYNHDMRPLHTDDDDTIPLGSANAVFAMRVTVARTLKSDDQQARWDARSTSIRRAGGAGASVSPSQSVGVMLPIGSSMSLDVHAFGARGDNTSDDTAALQQAIDAAQTQGRSLSVPAGYYRISSTLFIRWTEDDDCAHPTCPGSHRPLRLFGESMYATAIVAADNFSCAASGEFGCAVLSMPGKQAAGVPVWKEVRQWAANFVGLP